MSTQPDKIKSLHNQYCALTKMQIGLRFDREHCWHDFLRAGFTEEDLAKVIKRIMDLIKIGDRRVEALRFSNLVQQLDRFEEELALVHAEESGLKTVQPIQSVMDLRTIIEAKKNERTDLRDRYATEDAFGYNWRNEEARLKSKQLSEEINKLQQRLASLA